MPWKPLKPSMPSMPCWMSIAVVLVLGCGKDEDPGPPCEKVADHVAAVAGAGGAAEGAGGVPAGAGGAGAAPGFFSSGFARGMHSASASMLCASSMQRRCGPVSLRALHDAT